MAEESLRVSENLRHWEALRHTDPSNTKPFDRGRFKGTATKPIANIQALTEHFGPCGLGWGMDKPEFTLVPAGNELLVYCTVSLWYKDGEMTGTVYGVGGDKVLRLEKNGPFISDEAYKASYTDALGNAMKHIGVNADIHSGEFDKYANGRNAASVVASPGPSSAGEPSQPSRSPTIERRPTTAAEAAEEALAKRLTEIRRRLKRALDVTNETLMPAQVLAINAADLALVEKSLPEAYAKIIAYAKMREAEINANTAKGSGIPLAEEAEDVSAALSARWGAACEDELTTLLAGV